MPDKNAPDNFAAVDHSFIGKTPAATHAATNQALQKTRAFIDVILKAK